MKSSEKGDDRVKSKLRTQTFSCDFFCSECSFFCYSLPISLYLDASSAEKKHILCPMSHPPASKPHGPEALSPLILLEDAKHLAVGDRIRIKWAFAGGDSEFFIWNGVVVTAISPSSPQKKRARGRDSMQGRCLIRYAEGDSTILYDFPPDSSIAVFAYEVVSCEKQEAKQEVKHETKTEAGCEAIPGLCTTDDVTADAGKAALPSPGGNEQIQPPCKSPPRIPESYVRLLKPVKGLQGRKKIPHATPSTPHQVPEETGRPQDVKRSAESGAAKLCIPLSISKIMSQMNKIHQPSQRMSRDWMWPALHTPNNPVDVLHALHDCEEDSPEEFNCGGLAHLRIDRTKYRYALRAGRQWTLPPWEVGDVGRPEDVMYNLGELWPAPLIWLSQFSTRQEVLGLQKPVKGERVLSPPLMAKNDYPFVLDLTPSEEDALYGVLLPPLPDA